MIVDKYGKIMSPYDPHPMTHRHHHPHRRRRATQAAYNPTGSIGVPIMPLDQSAVIAAAQAIEKAAQATLDAIDAEHSTEAALAAIQGQVDAATATVVTAKAAVDTASANEQAAISALMALVNPPTPTPAA